MRITAAKWHEYIGMLSKIDQTAAVKMKAFLDSQALDYSDSETIEYIVKYAYGLSTKYGEAVAELSCQMYDATAEAQGANVPAAEPADTATYGETEKAIRGSLKQSPAGRLVPSTVGRLTKQAGADTMLKNAKRDGAYFAWIPSGDTCPFCMSLAALGWQRAGKKTFKNTHAEHIHANCNCEYAIDFKGNMKIEGYDPDSYLDKIREMTGDETLENDDMIKMVGHGGNDYDHLNMMRRQHYAANREAISVQKSVAYAIRNGLNKEDVEDFRAFSATGGSLPEWKALSKISEASRMMAGETGDWADTFGRTLSMEEREDIIEHAKANGIKIYRISKFDGDSELLKSQIELLNGYSEAFPRIFQGKRPTIAFSDSMSDSEFAETYLKTITYNRNVLRNREITERNMRDSGLFVNNTVEGITRHEFGHMVEYTYGDHGLEFAQEAYYNIFNKDVSRDSLVEFLRAKYSYYTVPTHIDILGQESVNYHEITPEMFSYNGNDTFADEFKKIWIRKGTV